MNKRDTHEAIHPLAPSAATTALLEQCRLPTTDLSTCPSLQLFGVSADAALHGMVGLEFYPPVGLLRSLAVSPELRGKGLGGILVEFVESQAREAGIETLYLLTTTAAPFFARLGYASVAREDAPTAIRSTAQFSGLCPASSTFMAKRLTP